MLQNLKIQNYALINDIEIGFSEGFVAITGETGTGKSILLGALGLILGNRVDNSLFRYMGKKCIIEGTFSLSDRFRSLFELYDLDFESLSTIRREITSDGRSRAFINDTPVQLNVLKELAEQVIDIHSQHHTLLLNEQSFQLAILDTYAHNLELLDRYRQSYKQYKNLLAELRILQEQDEKEKKDYDYLSYQLNEIHALSPQPGEVSLLEGELLLLSNAERILQILSSSVMQLYEDDQSINNLLNGIIHQLQQVSKLSTQLESVHNRMAALMPEIHDLYNEMKQLEGQIDLDQEKMEEVSNRLSAINHLLKKHSLTTTEELLDHAAILETRLQGIHSLEERMASVQAEKERIFSDLLAMAQTLSGNRNQHSPSVGQEIIGLLKSVGMKNAGVEFQLLKLEPEEMNENGMDKLQVLFTSNPGVPPLPISKVASGGELSRLMLCLKFITTESLVLPTIIFDEIDMGVSGEVAIQVGKMIRKLSEQHQVVCITHLPQIAAMGKEHLLVYKESTADSAVTRIRKLEHQERINEIAKMIGGNNPADTHIQSSKELIFHYNH